MLSIRKSALIVTDVQNDFCPGGALPVPDGDKIVTILNRYVKKFTKAVAPVFATRDWHPLNHISFDIRGGLWPRHCVQNTLGSEFHKRLRLPRNVIIISKAFEADKEAYSGFDGTELYSRLKGLGVEKVFVGGLATDYCVKYTVLDALKLSFKVVLLEDAIRGIDIKMGDSEQAVKEMLDKGSGKAVVSDIQ